MRDIKSLIDQLNAEHLCSYLSLTGWTSLSNLFGGRVRQYMSPNEEEAVLIPMDNSFSDYYREYVDTVRSISSYENISAEELLTKLLNPSQDLFRWRIVNDNTRQGTIPLLDMAHNINNIRDLFASAIKDIKSPTKRHYKVLTNDVENDLSSFQFGQTEIGSYVLNILCPLGNYQQTLFNSQAEDLPFGRQVGIRIMNGTTLIQRSINDNSSELQDVIDEGRISVNFVDAVSKIYENNIGSHIHINADWNVAVPMQEQIAPSTIMLNPNYCDTLKEIVERNIKVPDGHVRKSYLGRITSISTEAEVARREFLEIVVVAMDEAGKSKKLRVELPYDANNALALESFEVGAIVMVAGVETKNGRSFILKDASLRRLDGETIE